MRWKIKRDPVAGETRKVRRFAWWPVVIGEERVWLEFYEVTEELVDLWHTETGFEGQQWVEVKPPKPKVNVTTV